MCNLANVSDSLLLRSAYTKIEIDQDGKMEKTPGLEKRLNQKQRTDTFTGNLGSNLLLA